MRHGDKINNLGRKKAHRDALLSNLAAQLILKKRIVTTLAKAKALRVYVEPMITKTKKNENELQISHNHRLVFRFLQSKEAVKELFGVVGPKVASRPGGYTRIIKLGTRLGDNAEKAMIELVDFNEVYTSVATEDTAKKTRRSRRGSGGGSKATSTSTETSQPDTPTPADVENTEVVTENTQPAADAEETAEPETSQDQPSSAPDTIEEEKEDK